MKALTQNKLNALIQMAAADGHIAEEEKAIIYKIAEESGFTKQDVDLIIEKYPEPLGNFDHLDKEERLEFLYIAMAVMQADDLIFNSEIDFCKSLAIRLHIDPAIVDVYATRSDITQEEFISKAQRYVKD